MDVDLTAGEFAAVTGLSAKALRLYGERGILPPASVDESSGYRYYSCSRIQQGMTVDLLRRARVPMSELSAPAAFDFQRWRRKLEVKRHLEDFLLAVAERVSRFDPADFIAHSSPAAPVDWVGVIFDLEVPTAPEDAVETFTRLAVDLPTAENAFDRALGDLGVEPGEISWTATPATATGRGGQQMVLARPAPAHLGVPDRDYIAGRVGSATSRDVDAVSGTLPRRLEVTFTAADDDDLTPVDEAARGYLDVLAFERHLTHRRLTRIMPGCRRVSRKPPTGTEVGASEPVSVFDVYPPGF